MNANSKKGYNTRGLLHHDSDVLKKLIQGDESAFKQIYDYYWFSIYKTVLTIHEIYCSSGRYCSGDIHNPVEQSIEF